MARQRAIGTDEGRSVDHLAARGGDRADDLHAARLAGLALPGWRGPAMNLGAAGSLFGWRMARVIEDVIAWAHPVKIRTWWELRHHWVARALGAIWSLLEAARRALPKQAIAADQGSWLDLLKLCLQISVLQLELRMCRAEASILLLESRLLRLATLDLRRQERHLLSLKRNHFLAEPRGDGGLKDLLSNLNCAHDQCLQWVREHT